MIVGFVLLAGVYVVNAQARTELVPGGTAWALSPTTLTAVTAYVAWKGGTNASDVYIVYGPTDCIVHSGVVASGFGANGSLEASLDPGTTYYLYACAAGTGQNMTFTVIISGGVNVADVVAGVMILLGIGLLVVGARGATIVSRTVDEESGRGRA